MQTTTTQWRIPPWAWAIVACAIAAEATSNALRAYGLGAHLDSYAVTAYGHTIQLAGVVLLLGSVSLSLAQTTCVWVALTPARAWRQRLIAGPIGLLLLVISISAMASHVLEGQRAKDGDALGDATIYAATKAALDDKAKELAGLGQPRAVSVVQAEVAAMKIDMKVWRRSAQCSDITKDDTKDACKPILDLYKERGAAARKAEIEPEVAALREKLAGMRAPAAQPTAAEAFVAHWWAWLMGFGVVLLATFGPVVFATVETVTVPVAAPRAIEVANDEDEDATPSNGGGAFVPKPEALADLRTLLQAGHMPPSQEWLKKRWRLNSKGTVSKWLGEWETTGELPGVRQAIGRCKTVSLEAA